jgi:predicted secreted hydrolase
VLAAFGLLAVCAAAWGLIFRKPSGDVGASVVMAQPTVNSAGYARVTGPRPLAFPRDHGPHPEYQTEWWYYTGNLSGNGGQRFGYQLTFFRRAAAPLGGTAPRESAWAASQIYMAHFTVTDVSAQTFHAFERFERGAVGLSGAQGEPGYQVWLHDWEVEQVGENQYRLKAQEKDILLDLLLTDEKGNVLQGRQGFSQKGPEAGNASLYYSQPRLASEGTLRIGEKETMVRGYSWLDREISTSALSDGQVGWDWFALQLDDGTELMIYNLRRADGSVDRYSSGLFIFPDGSARLLARDDFSILPQGTWRSPTSRGEYPARWIVRVPALGLELSVQPQVVDQELNLSFTYWEGSVSFQGTRSSQTVSGFGYVEMTGYAKSMEDDL